MPLEFSAIEFEYCESLELLEEFFHKYINIRSCQLLRINPETKKWKLLVWQQGANRRETRVFADFLPHLIRVIENAGMLIIDEFGNSLHNKLAEKIIEFFMENVALR